MKKQIGIIALCTVYVLSASQDFAPLSVQSPALMQPNVSLQSATSSRFAWLLNAEFTIKSREFGFFMLGFAVCYIGLSLANRYFHYSYKQAKKEKKAKYQQEFEQKYKNAQSANATATANNLAQKKQLIYDVEPNAYSKYSNKNNPEETDNVELLDVEQNTLPLTNSSNLVSPEEELKIYQQLQGKPVTSSSEKTNEQKLQEDQNRIKEKQSRRQINVNPLKPNDSGIVNE